MTTQFSEALKSSGIALHLLAKKSGVAVGTLKSFIDGNSSMSFYIADSLAPFLGVTLEKTGESDKELVQETLSKKERKKPEKKAPDPTKKKLPSVRLSSRKTEKATKGPEEFFEQVLDSESDEETAESIT